ncbi:unnamed protein product, partial [Salmonella enterica subsp. enterica serovar Typhimurium str. DT2]
NSLNVRCPRTIVNQRHSKNNCLFHKEIEKTIALRRGGGRRR